MNSLLCIGPPNITPILKISTTLKHPAHGQAILIDTPNADEALRAAFQRVARE